AFFEPLTDDGTRWRATSSTAGPWDPASQHGGPPSALLGRAVERCDARDDLRVARVTVEILGAVPVGELDLRVRTVRPGRSVEMVEAALSAGGRDVARATAWKVRRTEGVAVPSRAPVPPPLPDADARGLGEGWDGGYLHAVDWRFVAGRFDRPGPATVWTRMRLPLVPDEEPSPLQRVLVVADSGNGVSSELDLTSWFFINPELTVHSSRDAVGEWVCLDAATTITDGGSGLATSVLSDQQGAVAVGAQTLLVAPR
ncbi:MAG: hypothetical protein JWN17_537, partial [Frankiales bacterium]|nr:hypothetical protein [Frankiales bacterium]